MPCRPKKAPVVLKMAQDPVLCLKVCLIQMCDMKGDIRTSCSCDEQKENRWTCLKGGRVVFETDKGAERK